MKTKSNVIKIDNQGNGYEDVVNEAKKVAAYVDMSREAFENMQLLTEEMLSMARGATGDMQASFWIECENDAYDLHLNTKTVLNKEQRYHLISTTTAGKNEKIGICPVLLIRSNSAKIYRQQYSRGDRCEQPPEVRFA